ncbi:ankyrin repeat domain-containing protein [Burkholderia vietnamiensis]|uniref:ankyrin repeat domain-containing protein n=1 Tax=Burkholderia vietnamiensis TaxID=60552 RepID=UPI001CF4900C|nr:hypothetical protein [Burkholderia vietnamiensis]
MVRHPLTPDELAQLPPVHQRVVTREPFTDDEFSHHLNDRDAQGNTVLHRLIAQMDGANPSWDGIAERRPYRRSSRAPEMEIGLNPGSYDARMAYNLVNGGIALDVRNEDGQSALDLARERYAAIAAQQEPGAAALARVGSVTNLLNRYDAQPGPTVDSAASEQAVLSDPMLLRDQVYVDDRDGVRKTWAGMTSPAHDDPNTSTKAWLFYDANSHGMMDVLGKELGLSPNTFPENYSSHDPQLNQEPSNSTPLQVAVAHGDVERAACMLEHGAMWGTRSFDRTLPLARAIEDHNAPMVKTLLDAGADTELFDSGHRFPALTHALEKQCPAPVVEALLQHGADPNRRDDLHVAPLYMVTDQHDPAIVDLLIDYGASVKGKRDARSPQFAAAESGDVGVCLRIAERGGDPAGLDVVDAHGNTPLAYNLGANEDEEAIAKRLLDAGASTEKAMQSPEWNHAVRYRAGQGTPTTATIARLREGEVLREAAVEALQEVAVEQDEAPVQPRARRRL